MKYPPILLVGLLIAATPLKGATPEEMNAAFGAQIWSDDNLWDDPADNVASQLKWPKESETTRDSSFRLYAGENMRILDARPYSLALYGNGGKVAQISMVFANKGDSAGLSEIRDNPSIADRARRDFKKDVQSDEKTIEEKLTALLGEPKADRFGQGRQTREQVKRWDWNGHAILLAAPRGEYVAVRIVTPDIADGVAQARVSDAAMKLELEKRVEKRPNGDVVLQDIPMVNQGPKGYCVPATWERAMRYMGIPTDMYVLAMAGNTNLGGGTSATSIIAGAQEIITRSGRRIDSVGTKVDADKVAKYIDKGLPVMWLMFSMKPMNDLINQRTAERKGVTDMKEWNDKLTPFRKAAKKVEIDREAGHCCMIIGYNKETAELAVSDSWGPSYAERWMTEEEANAVSQGQIMAISF